MHSDLLCSCDRHLTKALIFQKISFLTLHYITILPYTTSGISDIKENKIFLICKEIQSGAVAKSYMRKGFLIYEEIRKYFPIYEEAVSHV